MPPQRLDSTSPITYQRLTFETELPRLDGTAGDTSRSLPPPPDLTPYISPLLWPHSRKFLLLALSCTATFLTAYTAGSYSPPSKIIAQDLHSSQLAVLVGITTFCFGFALAPMVLAPLSELWGRYPVFIAAGVVYVVFQGMCALSNDLAMMLVARLLVGIGGSVFSSVVGGVIADLWTKEERNAPMALFSGSVLAGTGAGPLVASIMAKRLRRNDSPWAWKWVFWHQVIIDGVLIVALAVLFKESRGSVLLSRKAKALNRWYEAMEKEGVYGVWLTENARGNTLDLLHCRVPVDQPPDGEKSIQALERIRKQNSTQSRLLRLRWVVLEDEERASLSKMVTISVLRPFHMLFTEPVVFFFSLWSAFAWAVLYLTFASVPLVFATIHNMDIEASGHVFTAMIIGAALATCVGIWQEELLQHHQWRARAAEEGPYSPSKFWAFLRRHFPPESPEARLYFPCITAILLPAGLFVFGFTAQPRYHWIWPAIGICLATWGIYAVYLATFNYLADCYHKYASSALAAQSCCRNILGGLFPLATSIMYADLGTARAGGMLGGIAMGLTVIPWVLVFFGECIRGRSQFATVGDWNAIDVRRGE